MPGLKWSISLRASCIQHPTPGRSDFKADGEMAARPRASPPLVCILLTQPRMEKPPHLCPNSPQVFLPHLPPNCHCPALGLKSHRKLINQNKGQTRTTNRSKGQPKVSTNQSKGQVEGLANQNKGQFDFSKPLGCEMGVGCEYA